MSSNSDSNPSCQHDHVHDLDKLNQWDDSVYRDVAAIFRSLGDEGRLRTLLLIAEEDRCVSEIANILSENLAAVSQRLKLLKTEKIVKARREGKHIYYSLADHHIVNLIKNGVDHARE